MLLLVKEVHQNPQSCDALWPDFLPSSQPEASQGQEVKTLAGNILVSTCSSNSAFSPLCLPVSHQPQTLIVVLCSSLLYE